MSFEIGSITTEPTGTAHALRADAGLHFRSKNTIDFVHLYVNFFAMRKILFYTTLSGRCPVQEHLDDLPDKAVRKITWVLRVIRDLERVPTNYLKKLVNTDEIWEVRIDVGRNTFRLLGFCAGSELILLTNLFQKKTQETPQAEIRLAEERKTDYTRRRQDHG